MQAEYDCPWQSASGAQSGTSPSRIEGLREFEADLSALFLAKKAKKMSIRNSCQKNPHLFIIERGQNCGDVLL